MNILPATKGARAKGLFVCLCHEIFLCCDSAQERERVESGESFLISLKEIATMQVDLTQAFAILHCQLSIYSVYANKPELLSIAAAAPINI